MAKPIVYYGSLINPTTLTSYEASPNCLIAVSSQGNIDWIVHDVIDSLVQETLLQKGSLDAEVTVLHPGQFLMPGFIDTHTVWRFYSIPYVEADASSSMLPKPPTSERMSINRHRFF